MVKRLLLTLAFCACLPWATSAEMVPPTPPEKAGPKCMAFEPFKVLAKKFGLKVLMSANNDKHYTMVFTDTKTKNWTLAYVDKADPSKICIYDSGNGFDLDKDFILLDPNNSVRASYNEQNLSTVIP